MDFGASHAVSQGLVDRARVMFGSAGFRNVAGVRFCSNGGITRHMGEMFAQVIASATISFVTIIFLWHWGRVLLPMDRANHRSLHQGEVPRSGGIGIVAGALWPSWQFVQSVSEGQAPLLLIGAAVLAIVSLLDDFKSLPFWLRLAVQFLAAACLLIWLDAPRWGWLGIVAVCLVIVWSINLYNFMDGMDGLAGMMGVVGFTGLGVLSLLSDQPQFAGALFAIAGATAGFLLFNLPPARLFMGDVGSTFLGYVAIAASLWGIGAGAFPFWAPVLIFLPFWLDATVTLFRRLFRGERVWEAHRSHFYQRAALAGVPVRRVLLVETLLMLGCSAFAIGAVLFTRG